MKQISQTYRISLNEIRSSNRIGSHVNCVHFFKNNTTNHEMAKAKVCMALLKLNRDFMTEAIFTNGKRADVVDLEFGVVYEILETETMEEFKKKLDTYPISFLVIPLLAKDIIEGRFDLFFP